jgi:effector-binding domain-containing protein
MLIPIGRFSRAARLSIKSLRRYDESGLLPAAFVDPQSGYRYYRVEQLSRAETIRFLRIVDMPLAQIAETLASDDPESLLKAHLASLEHRRDEIDQLAVQLHERIERKDFAMSSEITIKTTPSIVAVAHRTKTSYPGIFDDIPAGFRTVMTFLAAAGLDPAGAPFTIYHRVTDADTPGDIAMCVPVAAPPETNDVIEVVEIPTEAAVSVVHQGSYEDLSASYGAVASWIHERGHRIAGPHREVYLNSPADTAESDLLTEILFPIDADGET